MTIHGLYLEVDVKNWPAQTSARKQDGSFVEPWELKFSQREENRKTEKEISEPQLPFASSTKELRPNSLLRIFVPVSSRRSRLLISSVLRRVLKIQSARNH